MLSSSPIRTRTSLQGTKSDSCCDLPFTSLQRVQSRINKREQSRNLERGKDLLQEKNRDGESDFVKFHFSSLSMNSVVTHRDQSSAAHTSRVQIKDMLKDA